MPLLKARARQTEQRYRAVSVCSSCAKTPWQLSYNSFCWRCVYLIFSVLRGCHWQKKLRSVWMRSERLPKPRMSHNHGPVLMQAWCLREEVRRVCGRWSVPVREKRINLFWRHTHDVMLLSIARATIISVPKNACACRARATRRAACSVSAEPTAPAFVAKASPGGTATRASEAISVSAILDASVSLL